MKVSKVFVILLVVGFGGADSEGFLQAILRPKCNFYTIVNKELQSLINNMFSTLQLPHDFLNRTRVRPLIKMHYDMNKISENYYNCAAEITTLAKVDVEYAPGDKIKLNEIITETIKDYDELNKTEGNVTNYRRAYEETTEELTTETKEVSSEEILFKDSKEIVKFVNDFVAKLNTLGDEDLYRKKEKDTRKNKESKIPFWEPPEDIEQDVNVFANGTRRIFDGRRAKDRFPFMVSVWVLRNFMCGGSIIASDLVITAASCLQLVHNNRFFRENPQGVTVRVGSNFLHKHGEMIEIIEVYFHPTYNPKTLANNIVLLRLQKHLQFRNQKKIKRIELDDSAAPLSSNINGLFILGWGATSRAQIVKPFAELMVRQLHIYPLQDCVEVYSGKYVTQQHFCAGFQAEGAGACSKDLGGPGVLGKKLVGIISFGSPQCGTPDSPTVFTKLGYYYDWIDTICNKKVPTGAQKTTLRPRTTSPYYWSQKTEKYSYKVKDIITTEMTNAPFMPTAETMPVNIDFKESEILKFFEKVIFNGTGDDDNF